MARQARALPLCLLSALAASMWLWSSGGVPDSPCALLIRDADMGEFITQEPNQQLMGLRMALQHVLYHAGHVVSDYDGDAGIIGRAGSESWLHMPSTQATIKNLEQELMAMKIGGLKGNQGKRALMHERRMEREGDLAEHHPESDMLHMARGVAYQSSSHLEEDLMSMKIGGVNANEGRRWEMHKRRMVAEKNK